MCAGARLKQSDKNKQGHSHDPTPYTTVVAASLLLLDTTMQQQPTYLHVLDAVGAQQPRGQQDVLVAHEGVAALVQLREDALQDSTGQCSTVEDSGSSRRQGEPQPKGRYITL